MKNMWIFHEKFDWIFMGFNFIVNLKTYCGNLGKNLTKIYFENIRKMSW